MTAEFASSRPTTRSRGGWIHFGVAVAILAASAVGFHVAARVLGIVLVKKPVPPPSPVETEEQRLTSFPETLGGGRYRLAADGELDRDENGKPRLDGKSDSIMEMRKEQVAELDVANHPMNWYYSAMYLDTQSRQWFTLLLTYYTGLLDAVPHVPTACLAAGGNEILPDKSGTVSMNVTGVDPPWRDVTLNRVAYASKDSFGQVHEMAEYYLFSLNGKPTASRYRVRGELALPGVKYCYFAKIQVAPRRPESSMERMDQACEEFFRHALPEILRFLPSAQAVRQLYASDGAGAAESKEE